MAILEPIRGYYNGKQIVISEDDCKNLIVGDEVLITILNKADRKNKGTRAEKRRTLVDFDSLSISSGRTVEEIDEYIRELRGKDKGE